MEHAYVFNKVRSLLAVFVAFEVLDDEDKQTRKGIKTRQWIRRRDNIQLSPEGEVNSGGYIPRREASRYTVPLKCKLPPSRAARIASRATGIASRATGIA